VLHVLIVLYLLLSYNLLQVLELIPGDGKGGTHSSCCATAQHVGRWAGLLARLQSAQGITFDEAEAEFGWKARDVRDVLFQLAKRQGYHTRRMPMGVGG